MYSTSTYSCMYLRCRPASQTTDMPTCNRKPKRIQSPIIMIDTYMYITVVNNGIMYLYEHVQMYS